MCVCVREVVISRICEFSVRIVFRHKMQKYRAELEQMKASAEQRRAAVLAKAPVVDKAPRGLCTWL